MEMDRKNGDNKALLAKIEELKDVIKKKILCIIQKR